MDVLDYELRKRYDLTLRAADTMTGSYSEAIVHVLLTVSIKPSLSKNTRLLFGGGQSRPLA